MGDNSPKYSCLGIGVASPHHPEPGFCECPSRHTGVWSAIFLKLPVRAHPSSQRGTGELEKPAQEPPPPASDLPRDNLMRNGYCQIWGKAFTYSGGRVSYSNPIVEAIMPSLSGYSEAEEGCMARSSLCHVCSVWRPEAESSCVPQSLHLSRAH